MLNRQDTSSEFAPWRRAGADERRLPAVSSPNHLEGTSKCAPQNPRPVEDLVALVESRRLTHVKVAVTDIDGILRGKYLSREKRSPPALDKGLSAFCDVVLGWDSNDQLYDNTRFTGWHTGLPGRGGAGSCPRSCRDIPFEPGMLL